MTIYDEALAALGRLTPLSVDCGRLCGCACCRGGPEHGMLLFPGEAETLKRVDFLRLRPRSLGKRPVQMAVCRGRCVRARRPLACRIYPLAPRLSPEGLLTVKPDPRARPFCPLLDPRAGDPIDPAFTQAVWRVFDVLRQLDGMDGFLRDYTAMLESYEPFFQK